MSLLEKRNSLRKWIYIGGFLGVNLVIISITLLVRVFHFHDDGSKAFRFLINVVYLDNFLKHPPILLGFVTLIGYLLLGRGIRESIIGSMKTAIGILLLGIGAGIIVGMAKPLFDGLGLVSKGTAITPLDPYFGWASAESFLKNIVVNNNYISWITYVFIIGFAVNILLVAFKKWTNVHSLMITGHVMFQQSAITVTILYVLLFRNVPLVGEGVPAGSQAAIIIISSLFIGIYWGVGSTTTIRPTNVVTNDANFAVGHQQMLAIALTYKIGRFFGKKEDSAENKILPKWAKIFEDNIFTQTILLFALFLILFLIIINGQNNVTVHDGKEFLYIDLPKKLDENGLSVIGKNGLPIIDRAKMAELGLVRALDFKQWNVLGGANIGFNIFFGSLKVTAGLIALMTGVRMFVTELQQAFQGISEKIIKNAVIAIDVAAVYGFSANSVTYGFLAGTIGQFIAVGLTIALSRIANSPFVITIPLFITLFFNSGSLGVYANASGGFRAALIVPLIVGFLEIMIISIALGLLKNSMDASVLTNFNGQSPIQSGFIGMADWNLFFGILTMFSVGTPGAAWAFVFIAIFAMLGLGLITDSGLQSKPNVAQKFVHKITKLTKRA
ncbi:PTS ascorbate transporter subunit IIC [Candidatus Mycoplasma pogonae]